MFVFFVKERSITFDSSSYHKLGDDSGAFTTKNDDDFRYIYASILVRFWVKSSVLTVSL